MVERAEPFGLDLGRAHQVALAAPVGSAALLDRAAIVVERVIVDRFGDRDVLVATKDGRLVVLVPGEPSATSSPRGRPDVEAVMQAELRRLGKRSQWRVAAGTRSLAPSEPWASGAYHAVRYGTAGTSAASNSPVSTTVPALVSPLTPVE